MHLINVTTLKLETFADGKIPPYAILSHTWGAEKEEVSFLDIKKGNIEKPGNGKSKLKGCCKQATDDGLNYAWIDTCCIDKNNYRELEEAINSMFQWYRRSSFCYAYLSDVPPEYDPRAPRSSFLTSRWFRRGWTLQELLAPKNLRFYNQEWTAIGTKWDMSNEIEFITGIPHHFLLDWTDFRKASVAQRLSWAAGRETSRKEDAAYCLLGIFDVTLSMIYGVGDEAMSRLQQEIMRNTGDHSILAWGLDTAGPTPSKSADVVSAGILATAPSDFANCRSIIPRKQDPTPINTFNISGGLLTVSLPLHTTLAGEIYGLLNCGPKDNEEQVVGIPLHKDVSSATSDEYFRPQGRYSVLLPRPASYILTKPIHLQMKRHIGAHRATSSRRLWLHINGYQKISLKRAGDYPPVTWEKERAIIADASDSGGNIRRHLARFRTQGEGSRDVVVVLEFEIRQLQPQARCYVMTLSRGIDLEDLSRNLIHMRPEASSKQAASIGNLHVEAIVKGDLVDEEPMLVITLAQASILPDATVDADLELQQVNLKAESRRLLQQQHELQQQHQVRLSEIQRRLDELGKKQDPGNWPEAIIKPQPDTRSDPQLEKMQGPNVDDVRAEGHGAFTSRAAHELVEVPRGTPDIRPKSEHDSAYASASRHATLTAQSGSFSAREAEQFNSQEFRDIEDVQSTIFDESDIGSQYSDETTNEEMAGKALFRVFLSEEPRFRAICDKALVRMSTQRLVENLRRLLKGFYNDLRKEAKTEAEKAIARLLRSRRGRLRISDQLVSHAQKETEEHLNLEVVDLNTDRDNKHRIETWLARVGGGPIVWDQEDLKDKIMDDDSSTAGSYDATERDEFPYIFELKTFLRDSQSFQNFRRDLMLMFFPSDLKHVLLSTPTNNIWVSQKQDHSLSNRIKSWVEDSTRIRYNWWPFTQRKRTLQDGESRLFWKCSCGALRWEEISAEICGFVTEILTSLDLKTKVTPWCVQKKRRVPLKIWFASIIGFTNSESTVTQASSAAQKYTPPGNSAVVSSSRDPPSSQSSQVVTTSCNYFEPTKPATGLVSQMVAPESWILLGVRGGWLTLTPSQIPIDSQTTDHSLFQELRKIYRCHRGWLRLWFSIWRLQCCEIVKFNRLTLERMVRNHKDLPIQQDYHYNPRAGQKDARNPPLDPHLFQSLFYTCNSPCNWPFPHECISPSTTIEHIERIPKRTKSFQRDMTSPIWGLETVFEPCVSRIIVYHFVLVAGPFAFWCWWLDQHPDDLQNASVPMAIVLGGLSLFWCTAGILTNRT